MDATMQKPRATGAFCYLARRNMMGRMEGITYQEFLAIARGQEARDRDRFTGRDSHSDQPMFDASTGQLAGTQDLLEMMAKAWDGVVATLQEWVNRIMEAVTTWANSAAVRETFARLSKLASELEKPAPPRHTYPRPHREWWNRR